MVEAPAPTPLTEVESALPSEAVVMPCRYGKMMFLRNDRYIGRSLEVYGEYSEHEIAVLRQCVRPGDTVFDVGANIGTLTLPLSQFVGSTGWVAAFEPQRPIYHLLCGNLALNEIANVHAVHCAIGATDSLIRVPLLNYRLVDNYGGVAIGAEVGDEVRLRTIDGMYLQQLRLIKIDVEGQEIEVIRGAAQTISRLRPLMFVENDRRDRSAALIAAIQALGYRLWWHFSPLFNPANFRGVAENVFGSPGSMNMVCVHRDLWFPVEGLREVTGPEDWAFPDV